MLVERLDFLVCVRPGGRHGRWIWFDPADVPELGDGGSGWYEIERLRGAGPRARKWRVVGPAPCPILPGGPCSTGRVSGACTATWWSLRRWWRRR